MEEGRAASQRDAKAMLVNLLLSQRVIRTSKEPTVKGMVTPGFCTDGKFN